jgi:hypothetical protein
MDDNIELIIVNSTVVDYIICSMYIFVLIDKVYLFSISVITHLVVMDAIKKREQ